MTTLQLEKAAPILVSRDIAAALERYKVLGFDTEAYPATPKTVPIYGFLRSGSFEIHIALFAEMNPEENTAGAFIWVSNIEEVHAAWKKARVQGHLTELRDTPYGLREFSYLDPDRNLLRVASPTQPSP